MTEKYAEKISMLIDDELQDHETANLIEGIEHDEWLRQCWERYHLIGDALKNNLPAMVSHDLASRVSRALCAEQIYCPHPQRSRRAASSYRKPVIGLALAASLVALAVLVVPWGNRGVTPGTGQPRASLTVAGQGAGVAVRSPVVSASVTPGGLSEQAAASAPRREVKVEPVLYDYLLDHNEYTDAASVQSAMLPYVRIVGYTSNAQTDHP